MAQTVTIDLGDGSTVQAEVIGDVSFGEAETPGGYGDVGAGRRTAALGAAVALTLTEVRDTVRGIGRWAAETITEGGAAGAPDSFEVEFGLKLAVKSGQLLGIIAEAGSEAGLTVRLSWDLATRRGTPPAAQPPSTPAPPADPSLPAPATPPMPTTPPGPAVPPDAGTDPATPPRT